MPKPVESCVSNLLAKWQAKPDSRPEPRKEGQSAEDQAWSICQASYEKSHSECLVSEVFAIDLTSPVRILPAGLYHRGTGSRAVTQDMLRQMAANFRNRMDRGIRRDKVVVDLEHQPGGVGVIRDVFAREDGLYAVLELSEAGRKATAERDYHYVSPTVLWQSTDRVTGEEVGPQLLGLGLTNYPFFGEATALYSELSKQFAAVTKTEGGIAYPSHCYLVVEDPQKPTTWHLRYKERGDGGFEVTKAQLGRAAAALGGGFRGRRYEGPMADQARTKLRAEYRKLGVSSEEMPTFDEGGDSMTIEISKEQGTLLEKLLASPLVQFFATDATEPTPASEDQLTALAEQFAQFKATTEAALQEKEVSLKAALAEAEKFQQELDMTRADLASEREKRELVEFTTYAEQFACLPGKPDDLGNHIMWLHHADDSEGKTHYEFFTSLLKSTNEALQSSGAFSQQGSGADDDAGSPQEKFSALVRKLAGETERDPVKDYADLMVEVANQHPDLAADIGLG